MKIKMLVSMCGPDVSLSAGDEVDNPDEAECARLIEAGYAEPIKPALEKATRKAPAKVETRDVVE